MMLIGDWLRRPRVKTSIHHWTFWLYGLLCGLIIADADLRERPSTNPWVWAAFLTVIVAPFAWLTYKHLSGRRSL